MDDFNQHPVVHTWPYKLAGYDSHFKNAELNFANHLPGILREAIMLDEVEPT